MKSLSTYFENVPIKSRLMLWSSILFFLLAVVTNILQYLAINQWLVSREQTILQDKLAAINIYLLEEHDRLSLEEIQDSKDFIARLIEKNQMVRIVNEKAQPILVIENEVQSSWVTPLQVKTVQFAEQRHGEDQLLIVRSPLTAPRFSGTIEIISNIEAANKILHFILLVMLASGAGGIVLCSIGGAIISRQLVKPVQTLTDTMRKVQAKGLHERVNVPKTGDELTDLAHVFNTMMDQLELSFQRQKQFVEDASHELRTPIAIIEGHLGLLNRWGKNDAVVLNESLGAAMQETGRLKTLAKELLELSRVEVFSSEEPVQPIHPVPVIQNVLQRVTKINDEFQFSANLSQIENAQVMISATRLEQILLILLDNAIKYSTETRSIQILGFLDKKNIGISVIDQGSGIAATDLPYIFDRFYRVDKARGSKQRGTGLGLAIAKQLVQNYRGYLTVQSELGTGSVFTVYLPVSNNL